MTCLDGKIKVEISTVLDDKFSFFDFIDKDTSKVNFTFLVPLNWISSSTQKDRMRQHITNSLDIDEDRSVSSHDMTVNIVVECLRCFGFEINFNFHLSLRRNNSTYGLNCKRI